MASPTHHNSQQSSLSTPCTVYRTPSVAFDSMSRRHLFDDSPARASPASKRKTAAWNSGEFTAICFAPGCAGNITRKTASLSGCENYEADGSGCGAKIVWLLAPAPCKSCAKNIVPGQPALGIPKEGSKPDCNGKYSEFFLCLFASLFPSSLCVLLLRGNQIKEGTYMCVAFFSCLLGCLQHLFLSVLSRSLSAF